MKKLIFILLFFLLTKSSFAQVKIDTLKIEKSVNHDEYSTDIHCLLPIIKSEKKCFDNYKIIIDKFIHTIDSIANSENIRNANDSLINLISVMPEVLSYEFKILKNSKSIISIQTLEKWNACCGGFGLGSQSYFGCFDVKNNLEIEPEIFLQNKDSIRKIVDSIFIAEGYSFPDSSESYLTPKFLRYQISETGLMSGYNVYLGGSRNMDIYYEIPYNRIKNYLTKRGRKLLFRK